MSEVFTPNHGDVAAKVIDGELIIIRLSDGTYYAMTDVGACVWQLMEAGHPISDLVRQVATWYTEPADRVETDVRALLRELQDEQLILLSASSANPPSAVEAPSGALRYEPPRLNIYRDMGNLLALDPPTPGIDDLLFRDSPGE